MKNLELKVRIPSQQALSDIESELDGENVNMYQIMLQKLDA